MIRTIVKTFFILSLLSFPLLAEKGTQTVSVQTLIEKVKRSSGDARRKAMNELKLRLRTASQTSRAKAMQQLRKAFSTSGHHKSTVRHTKQSISHQQMQQQMNMQHQTNLQHQMKPGMMQPGSMHGDTMPSMPKNAPGGGMGP
jgi:hypothetical protein